MRGQLTGYDRASFRADLWAGLTVGVMLIPQGMAYALIAGMPPIYGLYAALVPLLIYALWGSSRQLAVGPVAMVSLLVAAGVAPLAGGDPARFVELALLLSLLVGGLQLGMGVFRFGFLTHVLSHPVLAGFTSAAALVIGASQLHHLTGVTIPSGLGVHEILLTLVTKAAQMNGPTFALGVGAIFVLHTLALRRSRIPGALLVVAASIPIVALLGLESFGVRVVGEIPGGLPGPVLPLGPATALGDPGSAGLGLGSGAQDAIPPIDLVWTHLRALLPAALTIAFVGYMESIAVAKVYAARDRVPLSPNRELVALGLANIGGAFFQAFPTTGGFSRTAVNDAAGARSTVASLVSAGVVGLTLVFFTGWFRGLPNAILAAIVLVAVSKLVNWKAGLKLWQTDRRDFGVFALTFGATLFVGIEEGIFVGILASLLTLVINHARPHLSVVGRVPGTRSFRSQTRHPEVEYLQGILILRADAPLSFANAESFRTAVQKALARHPGTHDLVLDVHAVNAADSSAMNELEGLFEDLERAGVRRWIAGAQGPFQDRLERAGLFNSPGVQLVLEVEDAVGQIVKGSAETGALSRQEG